jgi:hypothetical protein
MEQKMEHKTTVHKSLSSRVVLPPQDCAERKEPKTIALALPEITPIWVEQTTDCRENDLPGPHVLSRTCIRWMW